MKPLEGERELIRRARREGLHVLSPLVLHYQRSIATVLRRILGTRAPIEDLLHDVFLRAFDALERLDERDSLGPWLVRVAHNLAVDRLRSASRLPPETSLDEETSPSAPSKAPSTSGRLDAVDRGRMLARALDRLPERHRMVLLYRYYLELDTEQISRLTGWSPKKICNLASYGQAKLREILAEVSPPVSPAGKS